jgi:hypothetical protein
LTLSSEATVRQLWRLCFVLLPLAVACAAGHGRVVRVEAINVRRRQRSAARQRAEKVKLCARKHSLQSRLDLLQQPVVRPALQLDDSLHTTAEI